MSVRIFESAAAAELIDELIEISAESAEAPHWTREIWLSALETGTREVLINEAEFVVAGFVLYSVVADEAEIESIAVRDNFQRQGVGRNLLLAALERLGTKKVQRVHLELRESNKRAMGFYRKHGFEEVGRRTGYYSDPVEDAILLSLRLTGN